MLKGYSIQMPAPVTPQPGSDSRPTPVSPMATIRHDSPLDDGKTESCDRTHTFDAFVPPHKLGQDKDPKRIGATWDVIRAIVKLKRPLRRLKRKAGSERAERMRKGDVDRNGLMRLDSNAEIETLDTAELIEK